MDIMSIYNSKGVVFDQCELTKNGHFTDSFVGLYDNSEALFSKCKISDNSSADVDKEMYGYACFFRTILLMDGNSSKITLKECEISNNSSDYFVDNEDNIILENCTMTNNKW